MNYQQEFNSQMIIVLSYQLYDIAKAGTPYKNAFGAPATVPEYTLHMKETRTAYKR